jgi:hypothetical protein
MGLRGAYRLCFVWTRYYLRAYHPMRWPTVATLATPAQSAARGESMTKEQHAMGLVKISANLAEDVVEDMRRRAEEQGITLTELLRQALSTQKFLQEEQDRGTQVVLRRKGETDRELVGTPTRYRTPNDSS